MLRRRRILIAAAWVSGVTIVLAVACYCVIAVFGGLGLLYSYTMTRDAETTRHGPVVYAGDGTFIDRGPNEAIDRFLVEFTTIDLNSDARYSFESRGLPVVHFVPYIVVSTPFPDHGQRPQSGWASTAVRLQIFDADELVFDQSRPLNEWTWTGSRGLDYSRLYLRDGGQINCVPDHSYRFVLTVSGAAEQAPPARFLLSGGGWKDQATIALHDEDN